MPDLIAVKPLKYPRPIAVGERFTVDDRAARVLRMSGRARDVAASEYAKAASEYATRNVAPVQSEDEPGSPRRQRRYQRRDMLAQD